MASGGAIVFRPGVAEDLHIGQGTVDVPAPAGGTVRSTKINIATFAFFQHVDDWTPGSVNPGSYQFVDIAVPGFYLSSTGTPADATYRHLIEARFNSASPSPDAFVHAFLQSDEVVRVVLRNLGAVAYNPGTGTLVVLVFKI